MTEEEFIKEEERRKKHNSESFLRWQKFPVGSVAGIDASVNLK